MKIPLKFSSLNKTLHDKSGVIIMFFLISSSLFFFSKKDCRPWITLFLIILFLVYDLLFKFSYKGEWVKYGRDYNNTLKGIRAAIQYTAILIGFVGVVLSSIVDKDLLTKLKGLVVDGDDLLLKFYAFLLLAIPTFMLLFIPVTYTIEHEHKPESKIKSKEKIEPSLALKNYLFLILFLQKVLIILCVYFGFIVIEAYLQ